MESGVDVRDISSYAEAELTRELAQLRGNLVRQVDMNRKLADLQRRQQAIVSTELKNRIAASTPHTAPQPTPQTTSTQPTLYYSPEGYPYTYDSRTGETLWGPPGTSVASGSALHISDAPPHRISPKRSDREERLLPIRAPVAAASVLAGGGVLVGGGGGGGGRVASGSRGSWGGGGGGVEQRPPEVAVLLPHDTKGPALVSRGGLHPSPIFSPASTNMAIL